MNNFDQSSTGTNIEFNGGYDTAISQDDFTDNFKNVKGDTWIYTDDCNLNKSTDDIKIKINSTNKAIINDIAFHYMTGTTFDKLREIKESYFHDFNHRKLSEDEILEILYDVSETSEPHELMSYLEKGNTCLDEHLEINYTTVSITGYSQGQYAEVILLDDIKNEFGKDVDFNQMFVNYFYRAPVYGELIINGEDYPLYEYLTDYYEWYKEDFLESFIKANPEHTEHLQVISEMLPNELSYD